MAYNGSGTFNRLYSWVTDRNNGTKIRADRFDAEMDGMATGLSNAICKDGQSTIAADIPFNNKKITGLGDAAAGADALNRQTGDGRYPYMARVSVASAATTDLSTNRNGHQYITGTTGITSFGAGVSLIRFLTFGDALTITHHATTLILPAGADITTAAGDTAVFASDTSGNWRCLAYTKADEQVVAQAESTLASASTTDIGAEKTERVYVTGTTTITSFGTKPNRRRYLRFADALTLTYNGTSLIIPGGASITTVAGDTCTAVSDGSGNWRITQYTRINDVPAAGKFIQEVSTSYNTYASTTSTIPIDDTIPQNTEGFEIITLAITPRSSGNKLVIRVFIPFYGSTGIAGMAALFQDSTANALAVDVQNVTASTIAGNIMLEHTMAAGTTSSTTFKVRVGTSTGTLYLNGISTGRLFGGVLKATMTITEYTP